METADIIILAGYLAVLMAVTWHFRHTDGSHESFFLAHRVFGALPIGLSVMVTTFSAVNCLAFPGEVCAHGLYVLASLPAFFLAALPIARYWMPYFHRLKPVSVYGFLEERFDLRVRLLAAVVFLVWRLFWMSVAFYASCKIASVFTGADFVAVLLVCGCVTAAYTSVGGMKAVVWTDMLQFCVVIGSILLATALICAKGDFLALARDGGRLQPFAPVDWTFLSCDTDLRITLWSGLFGSAVTFMTRYGGDQMVMQRYFTARSLSAARRGLWISCAASCLSLLLLAVFGLALFGYMRMNGVPSATPMVRVLASMLKTLPSGMRGLMVAGMLAATMSSIDSGLNSCAATLTVDFQERLGWKHVKPCLLTCILAAWVMLGAGAALPALNRSNTLFEILNKTVNSMGTPLLALMVCAMFLKRIGAREAFWGTLAGVVLTGCFVCTVRSLSLHYYAVFSLVVTLASIWMLHCVFDVLKSRPVRC